MKHFLLTPGIRRPLHARYSGLYRGIHNFTKLVNAATADGLQYLCQFPSRLHDCEGVTPGSMSSFTRFLAQCCRQPVFISPPTLRLSETFLWDVVKWLETRAGPDIAPAILECTYYLFKNRILHDVASSISTPQSCSTVELEATFCRLWNLSRKFIGNIRVPTLCMAFEILEGTHRHDNPDDMELFKNLAAMVCIQWKNLHVAHDFYRIIKCMNSLRASHARLEAKLEAKIPEIHSALAPNEKALILLTPYLTSALRKTLLKDVDLHTVDEEIIWRLLSVFWKWKIVLDDKPLITKIVRWRFNQITASHTSISVRDEFHEFALVCVETTNFEPSVQFLKRIVRFVLEQNQIISKCSKMDFMLLALMNKKREEVSTYRNDTVFVNFTGVLGEWIMKRNEAVNGIVLCSQICQCGLSMSSELKVWFHQTIQCEDQLNWTAELCSNVLHVLLSNSDHTAVSVVDKVDEIIRKVLSCTPIPSLSEVDVLLKTLIQYDHALSNEMGDICAGVIKTNVHLLDGNTCIIYLSFFCQRSDNLCVSLSTQLRGRLITLLDSISPNDVAILMKNGEVLEFLSRVGGLQPLWKRSADVIENCEINDVVRILISLQDHYNRTQDLLNNCIRRLTESDLVGLNANLALLLLKSLLKLNVCEKDLFAKIMHIAVSQRNLFRPDNMSTFFDMCIKFSIFDQQLAHTLAMRAIAHGPVLPVEACCKILRYLDLANARNEELCAVITNRLVCLKDTMTRAQILLVVQEGPKLQTYCTTVFMELIPKVTLIIQNASYREAQVILAAFTKSGVWTHRLFTQISGRLLLLHPTIPPVGCIETLSNFALMNKRHTKLFDTLFRQIGRSISVIPLETLTQLLRVLRVFPERCTPSMLSAIQARIDRANLSKDVLQEVTQIQNELQAKLNDSLGSDSNKAQK